jgi:1-acyl-sn-glycerol-3-phosphate acyltransferase
MLQGPFVALYSFFSKRKTLLWLFFFLSFGIWIVLALQIKLKQDVSSMLPDSKALKAMNEVVSNTSAGEQVIFLMSFKDTTLTDPDSLIAAATGFNKQVLTKFRPYVDTISMQVGGGGQEEAIVSIFNDYLPLFLTEQDYLHMDSMLTPEAIHATIAENRKVLLSPASVVMKQFIVQDPVGISRLAWKKLGALQFDPGYEIYDGYIFNSGQRQLTFFLKPHYKASETGQNKRLFKGLEDYIEDWEASHPGIHITYFGGPAVAAGNAAQMQTDTIVTLSVTVVLLLLLTWYFFRRKRTPLLLLVPVVYGAAMGMGIVYLVQGSVSVIALGAGAIILGIAIDFSIHFLADFRHTHNVKATIAELSHPLTIGSFTTIAAFLSLRFVETPILQDLGLFAAASLAGAALSTLIFLPHFPLGNNDKETKPTIFDKLASWQPERNKWLVLFIFLFTPVMLWFAGGVGFDSDLMHLNYLSPKLQKAEDEVSKANSFALSSVFLLADGRTEEEALQKLESVTPMTDSLIAKGWIRNTSNPVSLLSSAKEQRARIDRWRAFWTDERKSSVMASVEKFATEAGFTSAAFTTFQDNIDRDYQFLDTSSLAVLKAFFPGGFAKNGAKEYAIAALRVPKEHRAQVFEALSPYPQVLAADRQQGATQLVTILNKDFTSIAIYSSLIVFFALLIGYGRIELAIIAFLPMIISWIWILGIMSLLGLQFNIVNIIISSLIFGLGDDYAIFTMDGLIEKYRTGKQKLTSVRAAVYVSAVTVVIGLGVLLLAKHPALRSIAFISVTGLVCVLFISQTLQPFLFNFFIQRRADKTLLPFTLWSFIKSVFAFAYFFIGSMILTIAGIILTKLWPFKKEKGKYLFHKFLSSYTRSMMYIMANIRKRIYNRELVDFGRPAIYVANHSSFLDILCTTMLHPRMVLLTNRWVWRSPVFGAVVRMAEYYPVAEGAEDSLEPLKDLTDRGYSIIIFPEGTRSYDDKIKRFHKGAFYISESLKLDIVPLILHGIHYTMQKGDWMLKNGTCSIYYNERITPDDTSFGSTYSEKAKNIGQWMRKEFAAIKERDETTSYFREQLILSYIYKGPVLEWYCRIKTKLEKNYEQFHELIPRSGRFYDLGCGYGFMTYMLHWAAPERNFTGVDYDEEKIETAQHNLMRDETIRFEQGDLSVFTPEACDGIIISDVLHYMLPEQQAALLERCYASLNPGGLLIIRDGVSELKDRIRGTKLTELFSTSIFKFNKTQNDLHFISKAFIESFAIKHGMNIEILDLQKFTANLIFVLKKT